MEAPGLFTSKRINVVGTSGSGKTTMARAIAERLGLPYTEIDALSHGPNWTETDREVLRRRIAEVAEKDEWVMDGNYSSMRDIIWPRAQAVIWLDYSFPTVFGRVLRRTARRCITREELWHGNKERLLVQLFTRESILWWVIKTYRRRKRQYPELISRPENAHIQFIRLRSPRAADKWLKGLPSASPKNHR